DTGRAAGEPMSFGRHLRALRQAAVRSRAELARRVGVPVSTLRNWEGDRGMPGVPVSLRLAEALGVPVEGLAEGAGGPAEEEGKAAPEEHPGTRGSTAQHAAHVGAALNARNRHSGGPPAPPGSAYLGLRRRVGA